MAKRQKDKEEAKSAERPRSMWVRLMIQPGMPSVAHTIGPFSTRLKPSLKIRFIPGIWQEVNGEWAAQLQESALAPMCEFSLTKPE